MTDDSRTTLVLGGTGKTGRRVAARLRARELPTRVGSRTAEQHFDWDDETTWAPALDNVAAVYIVYFPDLAFPGVHYKISDFAELAVNAGVQRLVLLNGRGEETESGPSERAVQESGARWTILRCSWFAQNFSEGFMYDQVLESEVQLPAGDTPEPFLDAEDIADVAVASLVEDGHNGQIYELSGPRLMTFGDATGEIATAANRDVKYLPVTFVEYADFLRSRGLPRAYVELFRSVLDGRNAHLTDGVQRALGREPRDFREYATKTAATGVWAQ